MTGPSAAFVPQPAIEPDGAQPQGSRRLLLCAELGCEVVVKRGAFPFGPGIEVRTSKPVSRAPRISSYEQLGAALRRSQRLREVPFTSSNRHGDEAAPLAPTPRAARRRRRNWTRHERRNRRARRGDRHRPRRVDWSEPGPWTGEWGLMGGPSFGFRDSGVSGFGSVRAGFRFHRKSSSPSNVYRGGLERLVEGFATGVVGNHLGFDLQADYLGKRSRGHEWALTLQPSLAIAFPRRGAFLAGRAPALLGLLGFGLGGADGKVGFVVQLNPRASMLVTKHFGLDVRCTASVNLATGATGLCGLGGFVR